MSDPLAHPDKSIVVIGGGCWGHQHASHLLKAKAKGKTAFRRLIVVDRNAEHQVSREIGERPDVTVVQADWGSFLTGYVPVAGPGDLLVPAPIAPHLIFDWLLERLAGQIGARCERVPAPAVGTPFDRGGANGERFISFAEWRCPASCLEPAICPAIRAPRTWEVADTLQGQVDRVDSIELFVARHHAWGIATIPFATMVDAVGRLERWQVTGRPSTHRIATVSACHGIVGQFVLHPPGATPSLG